VTRSNISATFLSCRLDQVGKPLQVVGGQPVRVFVEVAENVVDELLTALNW